MTISPEDAAPYGGNVLRLLVNVTAGLSMGSARLLSRSMQVLTTPDPATSRDGSVTALVRVAPAGLPALEITTARTRFSRLSSSGGQVIFSSSQRLVLDAVINYVSPEEAITSLAEEGLAVSW